MKNSPRKRLFSKNFLIYGWTPLGLLLALILVTRVDPYGPSAIKNPNILQRIVPGKTDFKAVKSILGEAQLISLGGKRPVYTYYHNDGGWTFHQEKLSIVFDKNNIVKSVATGEEFFP